MSKNDDLTEVGELLYEAVNVIEESLETECWSHAEINELQAVARTLDSLQSRLGGL